MITKEQWLNARDRACKMLEGVGIILIPVELERMEVADFGLEELETIGLEVMTYINTECVCAKEIIMFPYQICPEHMHPPVRSQDGKEETFRCR